jgi:F-type H+-transporting ATPase subunit b
MKLSLTTFIFQIINFVLLAYILHRVLYKPIRGIMEKRKRLVMEDIDRALRMKDDAIAIKERYGQLTAEAEVLRKKVMEKLLNMRKQEDDNGEGGPRGGGREGEGPRGDREEGRENGLAGGRTVEICSSWRGGSPLADETSTKVWSS